MRARCVCVVGSLKDGNAFSFCFPFNPTCPALQSGTETTLIVKHNVYKSCDDNARAYAARSSLDHRLHVGLSIVVACRAIIVRISAVLAQREY